VPNRTSRNLAVRDYRGASGNVARVELYRWRMVTVHLYTGAPELYPNNPTPRPLLTFILAESRHTRRIFKSTANRLGEEEFPAGPRRYSENRPRGPLPPFA